MIEVKNIVKEFTRVNSNKKRETFKADDDISFKVNKGEIVGVLGPNGAGKTTLLRIMAGILDATSGEVLYDKVKISDDEIGIKKRIAYLSGNTKIYGSISCMELLKMCKDIYGINDIDYEKRLDVIEKTLNIEVFKNTRIENLSTGQTQRVNIARCLLHNPDIYILDEATSGLDIISSQIILDFIKEEKKNGKSIIYSTHYMEEAENICDRVVMINKGKLIKIGSPEDINKECNTSNLRDAFFTLIKGDINEK